MTRRDSVREFNEITIDKDCTKLAGMHENGLFHACKFDKLNDLTLKDCVLNQSKFITGSIRDALGFTVTLNCNSFNNVEISPLLFDLILSLMLMTKGNDDKREKLKLAIGVDRAEALQKILRLVE